MRSIALFIFSMVIAASAQAGVLTKQEYFSLYANRMPRAQIAIRMEQLYDLLSAAQKDAAKNILKQDLLDHFTAVKDHYETSILDPVLAEEQDVNDTTLP